MSFMTDHFRSIAVQESRALRLLYNAHGRYPNTRPADITEGLPFDTGCADPSFSTLYRHRANNEPACGMCKLFRNELDRRRRQRRLARN